MAHTGPYPHKDSAKIDMVSKEQLAAMKGFKQARDTSSEWLTKKAAVRQETDEYYCRFKSGKDT